MTSAEVAINCLDACDQTEIQGINSQAVLHIGYVTFKLSIYPCEDFFQERKHKKQESKKALLHETNGQQTLKTALFLTVVCWGGGSLNTQSQPQLNSVLMCRMAIAITAVIVKVLIAKLAFDTWLCFLHTSQVRWFPWSINTSGFSQHDIHIRN